MVHKLGHLSELDGIPITDPMVRADLEEYLRVLDNEYGDDRNVADDDGGYVLYCNEGTTEQELKSFFDYSQCNVEYVNRRLNASPPFCSALFLLNNEYAVVIVMTIADAPVEITEAFEEEY